MYQLECGSIALIKTNEPIQKKKKYWKQNTFSQPETSSAITFTVLVLKLKNQLKFRLKNLRSETEKQDIQKASKHTHKETETALAAFFQATTLPQYFLGQILHSSSLADLDHL